MTETKESLKRRFQEMYGADNKAVEALVKAEMRIVEMATQIDQLVMDRSKSQKEHESELREERERLRATVVEYRQREKLQSGAWRVELDKIVSGLRLMEGVSADDIVEALSARASLDVVKNDLYAALARIVDWETLTAALLARELDLIAAHYSGGAYTQEQRTAAVGAIDAMKLRIEAVLYVRREPGQVGRYIPRPGLERAQQEIADRDARIGQIRKMARDAIGQARLAAANAIASFTSRSAESITIAVESDGSCPEDLKLRIAKILDNLRCEPTYMLLSGIRSLEDFLGEQER